MGNDKADEHKKSETLAEENKQIADKGSSLILPDQALPPNLFIIPVNSSIIYPSLMAPMMVSIPRFVATAEEAIARNRTVGLILTKNEELREDVKPDELHEVGVVVKILKRLKMPDGSVNLLLQSQKRFRRKKVLSDHPHIVVEADYISDEVEKSTEMDALTRTVVSHVKKLSEVNPFFTEEMRLAMINAPGAGTVADLVAFSLALPKADAQDFLETISVRSRFEKLLLHLRREQDVADVQKKIQDDVNTKVTKMQRDFFLREQLKTIKKELGIEVEGKDQSTKTFRERIEAAGMPEEAKKVALEELEKFETIPESSPEHNVVRSYLELLCALPWSKETQDILEISHARKTLDADHYGLEKVKDRILEFLAVRKLKKNPKGSILCLVGPPGVGKTSVGKSVAKALGRNFYRFSLGGMRDEAEIKGHRRTYIGAMPGKIINAIKRADSKNAVLMLDEIDKLGASYQGDPASALLEVLDPEQNSSFIDHYLDVPFDLSKVLFIATANDLSSIPTPLLDRMEVIELPGYTLEEKEAIAIRYVIPKEIEENGLRPEQIKFERSAIRRIMLDYAREPGLRILQQLIGRICRKAAAKIVDETEAKVKSRLKRQIVIEEGDLTEWLGPKRYYNEVAERITSPGVVVGLAWTALGGDILFIESTDLPGSGNLKLTGQMGEVMTESAAIAWTYAKKKFAAEMKSKITPEYFKERDFHLHIPSGAIPKDGPSAGITMATSIYSLLTGRTARQKYAMTGELSLVGKVLPVGGIKEKILAARRAGITDIILPRLNEKDIRDVPEYALKGMNLHFVSHVEEVFKLALTDQGQPKKKDTKRVIRTGMKKKISSLIRRKQTSKRPAFKSVAKKKKRPTLSSRPS